MGRDFYQNEDWNEEEYPESWKPSDGDFIGGIVKRYDEGQTEYRGETRHHPICVIEVETISDGSTDEPVRQGQEVGIWLMHTVLLSKFQKRRPKPGERIGVRKLPKSDKGYHNYVMKVDRETEDEEVPDFGRYQTSASDHGAAPAAGDASAAYRPDPEGRYPPDREQKQVDGASAGGQGPGAPGTQGPPLDDDLPF